jgi:hypothetical protein
MVFIYSTSATENKFNYQQKKSGLDIIEAGFWYLNIATIKVYAGLFFDITFSNQVFGNLNSIQGSTLFDLVAYTPERNTIRV